MIMLPIFLSKMYLTFNVLFQTKLPQKTGFNHSGMALSNVLAKYQSITLYIYIYIYIYIERERERERK